MKRTININLGSTAFTIDDDAYFALKNYLEDIKSRLSPYENGEIIEDIEIRIAEIFNDTLHSSIQVVSLDMVLRVIATIGPASHFGGRQTNYNYKGQLTRSFSDSVIGGVCGGVGAYFGLNPIYVRLAMLFLILFGGVSILVYIALWLILPISNNRY